jgi:hypothetical protein
LEKKISKKFEFFYVWTPTGQWDRHFFRFFSSKWLFWRFGSILGDLCWKKKFRKNSNFSKSGPLTYRVGARRKKFEFSVENDFSDDLEAFWKKIWKIKIFWKNFAMARFASPWRATSRHGEVRLGRKNGDGHFDQHARLSTGERI